MIKALTLIVTIVFAVFINPIFIDEEEYTKEIREIKMDTTASSLVQPGHLQDLAKSTN